MPKVPYPYEVNGKLVTGNGSLIPVCSLSNRSLLPSLTVQANLDLRKTFFRKWRSILSLIELWYIFRFNLETEEADGKQEKKIPIFLEQNFTQFGQKLWDSRTDLKTTLIDDLKAMGPSAIGKFTKYIL